jgi:prolyl-tRNA editing enzyme YbaK/EbsC (Cys-tRNA(Pro) deacylase)
MKTIVDESLAAEEEIVIEANTHSEAIRLRYADFAKIERPLIARIAVHHAQQHSR